MRNVRHKFVTVFCAMLVGIFFTGLLFAAPAAAQSDEQLLVDKARITFDSFMTDSNMSWLKEHLKEAKGVLIVPSLLKAGFIFGGSGGSGALLQKDDKSGVWSYPAFFTMGSGSFGLQAGVDFAEVVMLVMTQKGLESLYKSSFKLGGDVAIAAGPMGAGASAAGLKADYLSYNRAKGAFLGFSLEGAVVEINDEWNQAYYGKQLRPTDIFVTRKVRNPKAAELQAALGKVRGSVKKAPVAAAKGT